MQLVLVLCFVFEAFGSVQGMASLAEQLGEVTNKCCSVGDAYARSHDVRDCTSSVPPEVPLAFSSLCQLAMDQCCQEFRHKKQGCDEGIEVGLAGSNCDKAQFTEKVLGRHCCSQCKRGLEMATAGLECKTEPTGSSPEDSLLQGAFEHCCASPRDVNPSLQEETHAVVKKPTVDTSIASLCEDYAPNELCAHHCIPVPGSYRCECNPGYQLMADKKNCMEVVKNRCKPRNPCQHKCNDNGVEVKCSCRRGYQLKADGKSCEDIDECKLNLCLSGTECRNYLGYYKCIPVKKNHRLDKGQCPPGFSRNMANNACDDINECELLLPPCARYLCENTVGGYKCGGVAGDPGHLPVNAAPLSTVEDRCPPGFKSGTREECEDVDECSTSKHDCNLQSQSCINTIGSFYCQDKSSKHCPPGFKLSVSSNNCEDVDECQDSHFLCPPDKICVNVPGAYDCKPKYDLPRSTTKCPDGMRINPGSPYCEDIDECKEGTHLCDQYQTCLNTNGSHECRCKPGFEPDMTGACVDMNECATDQNDCIAESQRCDNTVGSYICVRFLSCGTGYILHHATGNCEDIDECALGQHNCNRAGPNYQCVNIPGSFRCNRRQPSTTSTSTTAAPEYEYEYFYDSDEEPDANSTSTKTAPSKNETNVALSTTSTTEIPSLPTQSPNTPVLVYTEPSVTKSEEPNSEPSITKNYQLSGSENKESGTRKVDPQINLIDDNDKKPAINEVNAAEEKIIEKPTETSIRQDNTTPHLVLLSPPQETVTFEAVRGEDGSLIVNTKDVPKNEWTNIASKPEQRTCQSGFEPNGIGECIDIDECATNRHVCSGFTEVCRNSVGGYVCECAPGFRRDLTTGACDLITTSSTSTSTSTTTSTTTEVPTSSTTETLFFGYRVYRPKNKFRPFKPVTLCDVGYHMNNNTGQCEDINECSNGVARCAAVEICENTDGGYRCDCPPNWRYDDTKHRCVPDRDRHRPLPGYHVPNNTGHSEVIVTPIDHRANAVPSFTKYEGRSSVLQCRSGYTLGDDNTCQDIDECAIGIANCGLRQECTNLPGGYVCACPMGFKLGDTECEDIDECDLAGDRPICSERADCVNTIGSYQCKCHEGFRAAPANNKVCMDIDECVESRAGSLCQHRCNNVWGGFRCSCHRGYKLNADNRTCSDIDECTVFKAKHPCVGRCLNEPGSYQCACPSGYRLSQDKRSCIDIDECEIGEAVCSVGNNGRSGSNFCFNIRGSYRCEKITCLPGYRLENKHRCTKVDQMCEVGDWNCIHQPSTYSYHYITFVSKLEIPDSKVDLYTMNVPAWPNAKTKFELRLVKVDAPPTVKEKANIKSFLLTSTNKKAVVSIVQSLEGPQSIELELSMELYSDESFAGIAVAKLFIFVSEYEF